MATDNFEHLDKYFFGGEAEAEQEIRNDVFVEPEEITELLSFRTSRYKIITAPKEVGKTLFLSVINETILDEDQISLLITPKDIDCEQVFKKSTLADQITSAYNQILISAAAHVGTYMTGIGVSDAVVNLQKLAVDTGATRVDIKSRVASFLSEITPNGKEIAAAARKLQEINKATNILKNDLKAVLQKNNRKLWLLLDDLELAAVTKDGRIDYTTCWALICAAIDIANDFQGVRCIVSARSDIWHIMKASKHLGAERRDKIQGSSTLSFSEDEIRNIFSKRILLASRAAGSNFADIGLFFKKDKITLPGLQETQRSWEQWISKNSRDRPRDMVHLVQALVKQARSSRSQLIGDDHAHKVISDFSKSRIDNLAEEYQQICPQIKSVIQDFAIKTLFSFQEVIEALKKSPSSRSTVVYGVALTPNLNESGVALLSVLHMANFINPREELGNGRYVHKEFSKHPDFVSMDNWQELEKHSWEIHPTFHSFVSQNKSALGWAAGIIGSPRGY
jgi:hypothetical protein